MSKLSSTDYRAKGPFVCPSCKRERREVERGFRVDSVMTKQGLRSRSTYSAMCEDCYESQRERGVDHGRYSPSYNQRLASGFAALYGHEISS